MKAPRFWRIADAADLAWRRWEDEYVFHHALAALADACGLDEQDLEVILRALAKIDFLTWR